jgi:hypothetical protein
VYQHNNFVEFPHQAEWRLATEGLELTTRVVDAPPPEFFQLTTDMDFGLVPQPVQVTVPAMATEPGAFAVGETGNWAKRQWQLAVPRPHGVAHNATDLAAFKAGKSKGLGMWLTGFACLPGATVDMVGAEYSTSEHEFTYFCDALLGGSKPLVPSKLVAHHYNDVRAGRMYLELTNGFTCGVRSWKNKDALRGGQITAYVFNECYQLPGMEVFTGHEQNLRAERGYSVFTSTPDEPWVQVLHELGHGADHDWHCTCGGTGYVNPLVFSIKSFMRDCPGWEVLLEHAPQLMPICELSGLQPQGLMSKEKFLISHLGKLGGFVGRVYSFKKDEVQATPANLPMLFSKATVEAWQNRQAYLAGLRAL